MRCLELVGRRDRAGLEQGVDLLGDRLARPPRARPRGPAAPAPPRTRRPRGSPSRRCGRRPRGRPPRRRARTGSPAPRRPPLSRRCAYHDDGASRGFGPRRSDALRYAPPVPGAWLILPTYNEAENIEPIVRAVLPQLEASGLPHRVLVVDDGSPDGTGQIADRLAEEIDRVRVLHRPLKEGSGAPTWRASRWRSRRRGPDPRDGLRLLARPRRPAPADRRRRRGRPRARLALRARRRGGELGRRATALSAAAARPTRAGCSACRSAT